MDSLNMPESYVETSVMRIIDVNLIVFPEIIFNSGRQFTRMSVPKVRIQSVGISYGGFLKDDTPARTHQFYFIFSSSPHEPEKSTEELEAMVQSIYPGIGDSVIVSCDACVGKINNKRIVDYQGP
jgi:hypothetical protein